MSTDESVSSTSTESVPENFDDLPPLEDEVEHDVQAIGITSQRSSTMVSGVVGDVGNVTDVEMEMEDKKVDTDTDIEDEKEEKGETLVSLLNQFHGDHDSKLADLHDPRMFQQRMMRPLAKIDALSYLIRILQNLERRDFPQIDSFPMLMGALEDVIIFVMMNVTSEAELAVIQNAINNTALAFLKRKNQVQDNIITLPPQYVVDMADRWDSAKRRAGLLHTLATDSVEPQNAAHMLNLLMALGGMSGDLNLSALNSDNAN